MTCHSDLKLSVPGIVLSLGYIGRSKVLGSVFLEEKLWLH